MFTGLQLTSAGLELNTYLIANEMPLTLSKMQIGSGTSATMDRTALSDKKMEVEIESVTATENSANMVRATFTNEFLTVGFNVREVGIIAIDPRTNEGILYAYDNAGTGTADYFEAGTGNVILKEVFEIITSFGNVTNVQLTIDPQYVFATEDEINERLRNAGEFTSGGHYDKNDVIKYNDAYYIVKEAFSNMFFDFSKVEFMSSISKFDHFEIELDLYNFANPTRENGGIVYNDGCENFTQQDWIDWLGYKPCILEGQGLIKNYLDPENYARTTNGTDADITTVSGIKNVMIMFPRIGINAYYDRITKKGNIKITNDPNASGYGYRAFERSGKKSTKFFVGAYTGYVENDKLYSLSGKTAAYQGSLSEYREYAKNQGINYGIVDHHKMSLFQFLYIIQNGTINGELARGYSTTDCTTGELNTSGMNVSVINNYRRKYLGMESCCFWECIDGYYIDENLIGKICDDGYYNDECNNYRYTGKIYTLGTGYKGNDFCFDENAGIINNNCNGSSDAYFHCPEHQKNAGTIELQGGANVFETRYAWKNSYIGTGFSARLTYMI